MTGKKFIYNMKQANFFMEQGVKCLGVDKHPQTGKLFFIFGYNECQEAYGEWNKRNK